MKSNLSMYITFGCALHTAQPIFLSSFSRFAENQIKTKNKQKKRNETAAAGCLMRPQRNIKIYGAYRLRKRSEWYVENILHASPPLSLFFLLPFLLHREFFNVSPVAATFCSKYAHTL